MEGIRTGLNMKEKQAVTREYRPRYQKAAKKEKPALPGEFTKLTGYHRKSAVRLLSSKPVREVAASGNRGKAETHKPRDHRPVSQERQGSAQAQG
ncbi:MAG: hypothetical protein Pg6C_00980 [Treponemataceae bacterium]|nr:MAG: hypothetical protein Pg6C_00980 [Treponemataceae bacterium]